MGLRSTTTSCLILIRTRRKVLLRFALESGVMSSCRHHMVVERASTSFLWIRTRRQPRLRCTRARATICWPNRQRSSRCWMPIWGLPAHRRSLQLVHHFVFLATKWLSLWYFHYPPFLCSNFPRLFLLVHNSIHSFVHRCSHALSPPLPSLGVAPKLQLNRRRSVAASVPASFPWSVLGSASAHIPTNSPPPPFFFESVPIWGVVYYFPAVASRSGPRATGSSARKRPAHTRPDRPHLLLFLGISCPARFHQLYFLGPRLHLQKR